MKEQWQTKVDALNNHSVSGERDKKTPIRIQLLLTSTEIHLEVKYSRERRFQRTVAAAELKDYLLQRGTCES